MWNSYFRELTAPLCRLTDGTGQPVGEEVMAHVLEVTVDEPLNGASLASIKLKDDEGRFSNHLDKFVVGSELRIELGYVGKSQEVFQGEVTAWKAGYAQRGRETLTVVALDRFHRLRRSRQRQTNQGGVAGIRDSVVVDDIAQKNSFSKSEIEPSPVGHPVLQQWNQSDADFVLERAGKLGYVAYVDDRTLHFHPPKLRDQPVTTLKWHEQLTDLKVSVSMAQQQASYRLTGWNEYEKKLYEAKVCANEERDAMGGTQPGGVLAGGLEGGEPRWDHKSPVRSQEEADAYAKAAFYRLSERFVSGRGTCQGDPRLRRDTVVELDGIGSFLSGPYFVERVIHSFLGGSAYTTTFFVIRTSVDAPPPPPQKEIAPPLERPRVEPKSLYNPEWEGPKKEPGLVRVSWVVEEPEREEREEAPPPELATEDPEEPSSPTPELPPDAEDAPPPQVPEGPPVVAKIEAPASASVGDRIELRVLEWEGAVSEDSRSGVLWDMNGERLEAQGAQIEFQVVEEHKNQELTFEAFLGEPTGQATAKTLVCRLLDFFLRVAPEESAGIAGLEYEAQSAGVTKRGTTTAEGLAQVPLLEGEEATLTILFEGQPVATYQVEMSELEPADELLGQQQRLAALGYQLGEAGPDDDITPEADRAILDFQHDHGLPPSGVIDEATRVKLVQLSGV